MSSEETFPVVERFVSINGEGLRAGRLSAFIRMAGVTWLALGVILLGQMRKPVHTKSFLFRI